MGSCFGRCISKEPPSTCLWRRATDEQEAELVSNASDKNGRNNFVYRILKFKRKQKPGQFIDKFWERQDMQYAKLTYPSGQDSLSNIQLQNLDVNNLFTCNTYAKESVLNCALGSATNAAAVGSSRTSSSLDLEWEHEYVHLQRHGASMKQQQQRQHLRGQQDDQFNTIPQAANQDLSTQSNDSWQLMILNNNDCNDCNNEDNESSCQLNSYNSIDRDQTLPTQSLCGAAASGVASGMGIAAGNTRVSHQQHQQQQLHGKMQLGRNSSFTRTSSHNSWSHISTPESLEWDIDEEQQRQLRVEDDNLDHETLQLLHQIEQLKNQVLNETGDGLDERAVGGGGIVFSANHTAVHPLMDETRHSS